MNTSIFESTKRGGGGGGGEGGGSEPLAWPFQGSQEQIKKKYSN